MRAIAWFIASMIVVPIALGIWKATVFLEVARDVGEHAKSEITRAVDEVRQAAKSGAAAGADKAKELGKTVGEILGSVQEKLDVPK